MSPRTAPRGRIIEPETGAMTRLRRRDAAWATAQFDGKHEHSDTQCTADEDRHLLLALLDELRATIERGIR